MRNQSIICLAGILLLASSAKADHSDIINYPYQNLSTAQIMDIVLHDIHMYLIQDSEFADADKREMATDMISSSFRDVLAAYDIAPKSLKTDGAYFNALPYELKESIRDYSAENIGSN